jgi:hypothetical protein
MSSDKSRLSEKVEALSPRKRAELMESLDLVFGPEVHSQ